MMALLRGTAAAGRAFALQFIAYWITSSARPSSDGGIVSPRALPDDLGPLVLQSNPLDGQPKHIVTVL